MSQAVAEPKLDPQRQDTAKRYARTRLRMALGELALAGVLLLVLVFAGLSFRLARLFTGFPAVPTATLYLVFLMVVYEIITAPLSYYSGFVLSHRYGLSVQKFPGWLNDELKGKLIGLVLGAGLTALVYWFIVRFPEGWWLLTWGVIIVAGLAMTHLAPVIIVPLFLKMRPVADQELKNSLEELAGKAGVRVRGVYILELSRKGTTANAALMGLGNTRRIVLTDTLLKNYSPAEIKVIVAHELGHHVNRDIPRGFVIQAVLWLLGLFFTSLILGAAVRPLGYAGLSDAAALPLLMLVIAVLNLPIMPLINTYQRHREAEADRYALNLTADPGSFISMMTRLTDQNLSEAEPSRWVERLIYDHPSYVKRVAQARRFAAGQAGG